VLAAERPGARVLATEVDVRAASCARANGVAVLEGDLYDPLPPGLRADLVAAVVPYVPTGELGLLQRDTFTFESALAYDGGPDGTDVLRRVVDQAPRFLVPGGALVLELGGDQSERLGLGAYEVIVDEDGDVRGLEATFP
jgi:release factor glutamine methyltransferase